MRNSAAHLFSLHCTHLLNAHLLKGRVGSPLLHLSFLPGAQEKSGESTQSLLCL